MSPFYVNDQVDAQVGEEFSENVKTVADEDLQMLLMGQASQIINEEERPTVNVSDDIYKRARSPLSPMNDRSNQPVKTYKSPTLHSTRITRDYIPSHSGNVHNIRRNPSQTGVRQHLNFSLKPQNESLSQRREEKFLTKFNAPPTPMQTYGNPSPDYITGGGDINNTKFANVLKKQILQPPIQPQSSYSKVAGGTKFNVSELYGKDNKNRGPRFSNSKISAIVPKIQSFGHSVMPGGRNTMPHPPRLSKPPTSTLLQKRSLSDC